MKLAMIDGAPFVRNGNNTRPLDAVLADFAEQASELDESASLASQASALAHDALVSALVSGDDVDNCRERLTHAEANRARIAEQRRELDAQAANLRSEHAAAVAKRLTAEVAADLAALARPFDNELRKLS